MENEKGITLNKRLIALGINHPQDLKEILKCSDSLALKLWYRKANLSRKMAQKLKKKTGYSLDFLNELFN